MSARFNYLRPDQLHALRLAVTPINDAFDDVAYQVGSSLVRADYRDVDVRMIWDDAQFAAMFGHDLDQHYGRCTALWSLLCSMISRRLSLETGLPVDFQIQARSTANADRASKGGRNALFLDPMPVATRPHAPQPDAHPHREQGRDMGGDDGR